MQRNQLYLISLSLKVHFLLAMLLCVLPLARSQNAKLTFEHFSSEQGLSQGSVRYIFQDPVGYLWFATFDGINSYDGYSLTAYQHDPQDSTSLVNGLTNTLYEDRAGNFWVGAVRGLERFDRTTGKFTHYHQYPLGSADEWANSVLSICEDRDGVLWVGTTGGVSVFDRTNGAFAPFQADSAYPGGIGSSSIRPIHEDKMGSLWFGTSSGLSKFDKRSGTFTLYRHDFMAKDHYCDWIFSIYEDERGIFWLGGDAGLVEFNPENGSFTHYRHNPKDSRSISSNVVTSISEGQDGRLWVGTYNDGLNVFDRGTKCFTRYAHNAKDPNSLSSNGTQSVYCERSGTIWIATIDQGLNKVNLAKPPFMSYPYDDQAPNTAFPQAFADNSGKIWVHASNEWKKFDPGTESFIRQPLDEDSFPLVDDRAGNLWIGKMSGGLYKRNSHGETWSFHDSTGLKFRKLVTAFIQAHDGRFWMGTEDGEFFEVDPAAHSVRLVQWVGTQINTMYEDASGLLWLGTWNTGLICYNPARQTSIRYSYDPRNPASLNADFVVTVYEDKAGILWVGTIHGLDRFDRATGSFTHFTTKDGLPGDWVSKIIEDDLGNLWLGTLKGISKFEPKAIRFKNYDISYGIAYNSIRNQSGCKTKNGEIYFGGKGLTRFHPDSIRDNPFVPPIVVTQFRLFEKPTPFNHEVNLSYRENSIAFEFAALSYVSPERNQYAYKMEGIDPDWVYSGTRRYAGYPRLAPGKYVFRVKGSNNDGVWNEQGTSIVVVVTPPLWETGWFRGFALIAILLSVGGGIRYVEIKKLRRKIERLENERALDRERTRISQDMHDEVGASLTEIAILSELARKEMGDRSDMADSHIRKIADRSREVVDNMSEIIWTINPKNDHLNDLVAYLRQYATLFLKSTAIRCRFESPDAVPEFSLSAEVRRHIFLVVKEALHNVVKHSHATETTVKCNIGEGGMEVSVEDNGTGFPVEQVSRFGNGVLNMRKRIEAIGGTFTIDSRRDAGTRVCISVPIAASKAQSG